MVNTFDCANYSITLRHHLVTFFILKFPISNQKKQRSQVCGEPIFIYITKTASLLQRDETRRVCSSNTRATVLDRLVGDGELSQVVATHLRLEEEGGTD